MTDYTTVLLPFAANSFTKRSIETNFQPPLTMLIVNDGRGIIIPPSTILYRGRLGANYVYNVGSPPTGATDVVIVKF